MISPSAVVLRPGAGRSSLTTRAATSHSSLPVGDAKGAGRHASAAGGADPQQGRRQLTSRPLPQGAIVGVHFDEQADGAVSLPGHPGPAECPQQGQEWQQDQVMAFPQVRALVREHGRQLVGVQQVEGSGADHDRGPQARQAVRGGGRVVDDQRAGHFGVTVGQQAQQLALALAGPHGGCRGGDQNPAQHRQQDHSGGQADQPERSDQVDDGRRNTSPGYAREPGERAGGHCRPAGGDAEADERPDGGQAPAEPDCLPEEDGRSR